MYKKTNKTILKGIMSIILGVLVLSSSCYKGDGDATVTIHFKGNRIADNQPKHIIDRILGFFSKPAYAAWSDPCDRLKLTISGENIEEQVFDTGNIGGITDYTFTAVVPAVANVTFEILSFKTGETKPNWGGGKIVTLRPGNQGIDIAMIPMTEITSTARWGSNSVIITFDNITSYCNGYNIYRSTEENSNYKLIGKVNATDTSFTDNSVNGNMTYYYRVSIINSNGEGLLCAAGLITIGITVNVNQEITVPGTYVLRKDGVFVLESTVAPGDIANVRSININTLTLIGGGGAGGAGGSNRSANNGRGGGGGGGSGLLATLDNTIFGGFTSCSIVIGEGGSNSWDGASPGGFGFPSGDNGTGCNGSQGGNGGGGGGASALVIDGTAKLTAPGGGGGGAGGGQDDGGAMGADGGANPGSGGFTGISAGGAGSVATRSGGGGKGRYQGFPQSEANNSRQAGGGGAGFYSDGNDTNGGSGLGINNGLAGTTYYAAGEGGSGYGGGGGGASGGYAFGAHGGKGGDGYCKIVAEIFLDD